MRARIASLIRIATIAIRQRHCAKTAHNGPMYDIEWAVDENSN